MLHPVVFATGNRVLCWQDFRAYNGAPAGVMFAAMMAGEGWVKLIAPGYGITNRPDVYGNGCIYISMHDYETARRGGGVRLGQPWADDEGTP